MVRNEMANLVVRLSAQTDQFQRAMTQNQAAVAKLTGTIKALGLAAIGAAGIGGMGMLISSTLRSTDALAKQARRLDITLAQMDAFDLAFRKAGASSDSVVSAFTRIETTISKAIGGNAGAIRMIESLGVSLSDVATRDAGEAFMILLGGMENLTTRAQRTAAASRLFGQDVAKALSELSPDALQDASDRIAELNETMGGMDGKSIEQINDAITDLQKTMELLARETLAETADAWVGIAEGAAEAVKWAGKYVAALGAVIDASRSQGWGWMGQTAAAFAISPLAMFRPTDVRESAEAITAMTKGVEELDAAVQMFGQEFVDALNGINREMERLAVELDPVIDKIREDMVPAIDHYNERVNLLTRAHEAELITLEELQHGMQMALEEFQKAEPMYAAATAATEKYADQTAKLTGEMEELKNLFEFGLIDSDTLERGLQSLQDQLNELDPEFVTMRDRLMELESAAEALYKSTRTPLEALADSMAELNEMLERGVIDWDLYGRGVEAAMAEADAAMASGVSATDRRTPLGAGVASGEAIRGLMLAGQIGGGVDVDRQQLQEMQLQRQLLERVVMNTQQRAGVYA